MTRTEKIKELAQRLYDLDIYNAMDNDETPHDIVVTLTQNPLIVIDYLVHQVEELQYGAVEREIDLAIEAGYAEVMD